MKLNLISENLQYTANSDCDAIIDLKITSHNLMIIKTNNGEISGKIIKIVNC